VTESESRERAHPTLWVDVGSFLEFFRYRERPSGIQRVEMEIYTALARFGWPRAAVRFCRLERSVERFERVDPATLARVFHDPPLASGSLIGRLIRALRRMLRARRLVYLRPAPLGTRTERFRRGDLLLSLGTSWENPRYVEMLDRARRTLGVRIAVLIYDVIPVAHAEWVDPALRRRFGRWLDGVLANAHLLFTISGHSRADLLELGVERRIVLPPVEVLRLGCGFAAPPMEPGTGPGFPERFVLYVSTIEPRKNHALLLRVWRRLIERHGAEAVPPLVLVGRVGWLVDDLLSELSRDPTLGAKVGIRSGLSDAEVAEAYRRCLFTVFPSLMEGWGLPVTESLEQGKLCVASNVGAIPEAGGDLVDYFDPRDEAGALAAIERAIFDAGYHASREARIREAFRPRSWADCVADLLAQLDRLTQGPPNLPAGSAGSNARLSRVPEGAADVV